MSNFLKRFGSAEVPQFRSLWAISTTSAVSVVNLLENISPPSRRERGGGAEIFKIEHYPKCQGIAGNIVSDQRGGDQGSVDQEKINAFSALPPDVR
jgi:hypothetical protein